MTYKPELIKKNNVYVVNSRIVAKELGKEHNRVLKDIDKILEKSDLTSLIIPSTYRVPNQRRNSIYQRV